MLTTGTPTVDVVRESWWNGAQHWLSETRAPIRDLYGATVGLVGVSRDVTERIRTEEALRESEQRLNKQRRILNSILDSMGEGVIAVGREREILLFNQRAKQMLESRPARRCQRTGRISTASARRTGGLRFRRPRIRCFELPEVRARRRPKSSSATKPSKARRWPSGRRRYSTTRASSPAASRFCAMSLNSGTSSASSRKRKRWMPSVVSLAGSPTTSTISSPSFTATPSWR